MAYASIFLAGHESMLGRLRECLSSKSIDVVSCACSVVVLYTKATGALSAVRKHHSRDATCFAQR